MYGTCPISRGLNSKRLILPPKGEVHDLFVWEWGVFGTLSLDCPVLAKERLFGGPGAWAQGRLWPWPQQQHSGQSAFMPESGKHYTAW